MNISEAITTRRSIKKFAARSLLREEIEPLLEAATFAPNHRLSQPWRYYVLGPEARAAYGLALGDRKARKIEDATLAQTARERTRDEHQALPAMIAVTQVLNDNLEIREEDYAATMMSVQNIALAAVERGLGTHIKTGAVMQDPVARAAVGVADNEKIVAVINVGYPDESPEAKPRRGVAEVTTWLP